MNHIDDDSPSRINRIDCNYTLLGEREEEKNGRNIRCQKEK